MLGPEHPHVAGSYHNLGCLYHSQGRLEEALRYFRQALQIQRKACGDVHPHTALFKHNIGRVLEATGQASEARAMLAEAAAVRRTVLGPDHPLTKQLQYEGSAKLKQIRAHTSVCIRFQREPIRFLASGRVDDKWKKKYPQYAQGGLMVLSCRARMCRGARVSARRSGR